MTEQEFRQKYPHSTDEQVRLYLEAVKAEQQGIKPIVEPDIPMPMIVTQATASSVPVRQIPTGMVPEIIPQITATTYTVPRQFYTRHFTLDDAPLEVPSAATAGEMRDILLGPFGSHLSDHQRQLFQTTDMSADDMLAHFFDPKAPTQSVGL